MPSSEHPLIGEHDRGSFNGPQSEIIYMLTATGYLRPGISTLSSEDKINLVPGSWRSLFEKISIGDSGLL